MVIEAARDGVKSQGCFFKFPLYKNTLVCYYGRAKEK
jgi:hypothetical protein